MEAHFIAFDRVYTLQGGQMQQLVNRQRTFLKCTGVEDLGGRWLRVDLLNVKALSPEEKL